MTDSTFELPEIGLGTWPARGADCVELVRTGIDNGYRLIDTAANYDNEGAVGKGLRDSGAARDEYWVSSKLKGRYHGERDAVLAVEESLYRMGLDELDLYLIHWPNPRRGLYVEAWRGLIEARRLGLVRHIGVCNFTLSMIDELIAETGVAPVVDQIELYPYWNRGPERAGLAERGIRVEAWSPLGRGGGLLYEPLLVSLAAEYGVPVGTLVLRWHHQHGVVPLPKSASPERQRDNLAIGGFVITAEHMRLIDALNGTQPENELSDPEQYEQL